MHGKQSEKYYNYSVTSKELRDHINLELAKCLLSIAEFDLFAIPDIVIMKMKIASRIEKPRADRRSLRWRRSTGWRLYERTAAFIQRVHRCNLSTTRGRPPVAGAYTGDATHDM
jgi:hypothetical protein